ncbi:MAG: DUF333 domain-containing protein [Sphingobium sp.]|nr:DUF333 domain-containing protein [Sphingobium sp.]
MLRLVAIGGIAMLSACGAETSSKDEPKPVGMPNPASVHCTKMGGKLEIRKEANGEVGYCRLPDGRVVEEWELFRASQK